MTMKGTDVTENVHTCRERRKGKVEVDCKGGQFFCACCYYYLGYKLA